MSEIPFETLTRTLHRYSTQLGKVDGTLQLHDATITNMGISVDSHTVDLADLRAKLNALLAAGLVTNLSPLTVRFQDESEALPNYSLLDPAAFALNDRVLVARSRGDIIILGKVWTVPQ